MTAAPPSSPPLRQAGEATLRAFAGLDPATGLPDGEARSEFEEFLRDQAFEDSLLGLTPEELNEIGVDAIIERVREVEEQSEADEDGASQHLSASELESLPARAATDREGAVECSVCLASLSAGQGVVRLPCAHIYHHACIVRWLASSRRCPFCRASAVVENGGRSAFLAGVVGGEEGSDGVPRVRPL